VQAISNRVCSAVRIIVIMLRVENCAGTILTSALILPLSVPT
jgi:hypothetical protein